MRRGTRRWWRRAGRCLAALAFVGAIVLTATPVPADGVSTCGSLLSRQQPVAENAAHAARIDDECGKALVRQGGAVLTLGAFGIAVTALVALSRRRAQHRYDLWRAGRIRAGLPAPAVTPAVVAARVAVADRRPLLIVHEFEPTDIWSVRPSLPPAAMAD